MLLLNESPWPDQLAERLLDWARALQPELAAPLAETLKRCISQLEAARADGHVLLDLGAVDAARLRASGLVEDASEPGFPRGLPLVLEGQQLYLHRDHEHERVLAARLRALMAAAPQAIAPEPLRSLFPPPGAEPDWQALAVAQALRQRLTVISGGPGTGKTSTVVKLLACVLADQPQARIQLAAPTGKAAQRMLEALRQGSSALASQLEPVLAQSLMAALPREALTLHRLLGATPGGWLRGADSPLDLDWLIVDEASMLDLALARQLLDALPEGARLVLLGDRHQLAAVENGAVLAELSRQPAWSEACRSALQTALGLQQLDLPASQGLQDLALQFQRSHRFAADSGIGRLAAAVREGHADKTLALLAKPGSDLRRLDDWRPALAEGLRPYEEALQALLGAPGQRQQEELVWSAWEGFRVLCAAHGGPLGTRAVNEAAASLLAEALGPQAPAGLGQPLLVTRNQGQLVNGDVLLLLPGPDGALVAKLRRGTQELELPLERLPAELDGAFAMTVHKSQGSEFERLLLLVPELPWLTREWLYTGITRARSSLSLLGSDEALRGAVLQATERRSGLRARLQSMGGESA